MTTQLKQIGRRLKALRNARKLTQAVVAEAIGIERASLSMIETGKDGPGLATLQALSDYFNVTLDYLKNGTTALSQDMPGDRVNDDAERSLLQLWRILGRDEQLQVLADIARRATVPARLAPPVSRPLIGHDPSSSEAE